MACPVFTFVDVAFTDVVSGHPDTVTLPSYSTGDLLILYARFLSSSVSIPGWSVNFASGATSGAMSAFYRIADGTEGSTVSVPAITEPVVGRQYAVVSYSSDTDLSTFDLLPSFGPNTQEGWLTLAGQGEPLTGTDVDFVVTTSSTSNLVPCGDEASYFMASFIGLEDGYSLGTDLITVRGTHDTGSNIRVSVGDVLGRVTIDDTQPTFTWHGTGGQVLIATLMFVCQQACPSPPPPPPPSVEQPDGYWGVLVS